jgi:hypothetical protein
MEVLLVCLGDENVEVREMASKVLSGVIRCSQRQNIIPLKVSAVVAGMAPSHGGHEESVRCLDPQNYPASKTRPYVRGISAIAPFGDSRIVCAHRKPPILCRTVDAIAYRG